MLWRERTQTKHVHADLSPVVSSLVSAMTVCQLGEPLSWCRAAEVVQGSPALTSKTRPGAPDLCKGRGTSLLSPSLGFHCMSPSSWLSHHPLNQGGPTSAPHVAPGAITSGLWCSPWVGKFAGGGWWPLIWPPPFTKAPCPQLEPGCTPLLSTVLSDAPFPCEAGASPLPTIPRDQVKPLSPLCRGRLQPCYPPTSLRAAEWCPRADPRCWSDQALPIWPATEQG